MTEKDFIIKLIAMQETLKDMLEFAPPEEDCTDTENEMFANMQNLIESIENYF